MIFSPFFKNELKIENKQGKKVLISGINLFILSSQQVEIDKFPYEKIFSEFEISTIDKRKKYSAKQEYLASRYIIKKLISTLINCEFTQIETKFNQKHSRLEALYNNKPLPISISISHSKGMVCVALSQMCLSFGVDLEHINQKRSFIKLANHFYHEHEVQFISTAQQPHNIFYRIWTLKEALAKTIRLPISQLLSKNVFEEIQKRQLYTASCHYDGFDITLINNTPLNNVVLKTINMPLSL
ncbi:MULTISPECIES: 4'-phosphopantetheinyl transferase superfamily protein [unclassified Pseudoalteromonas]|uniref:4'-phosphopantetheinyl transferase family protein n=1 Tax=unclassified Pseudoalteromonas TaxID=194690 RepID=UPI0005A6858E|nr:MULTISPECIES: 4'-phosphopantetheinyl transferase superfamily protein [unclassified Pseudoalteromonas]